MVALSWNEDCCYTVGWVIMGWPGTEFPFRILLIESSAFVSSCLAMYRQAFQMQALLI